MRFSSLVRTAVPSALLLSFAAGCAHVPEPVASPNGQPLSIREHTETQRYVVKEKVGEVEYKNSYGEKVGSGEVYQNRLQTVHYQVWAAYQGDSKISDDDLYRIARDERAEREVKEKRESGVLLNRIGLGAIAAGALAAVGGYAMMTSQARDTDATGQSQMSPLPTGLLYGGLITASVGGLLTWIGFAKSHNEHPLDQDRATEAATRYNASLPGTTTTTNAVLRYR